MKPEDRRRLEDALSDLQLRGLHESCADWGIGLDEWPTQPTLRQYVETTAVKRRVRYLRRTYQISETTAVRRACEWFNLAQDWRSVNKRIDRITTARKRAA